MDVKRLIVKVSSDQGACLRIVSSADRTICFPRRGSQMENTQRSQSHYKME